MSKVIQLMREFPKEERSWEDVLEEIKSVEKLGNKVVARSMSEATALVEIILEDEKYSHVRIHNCTGRKGSFYELEPVKKAEAMVFPSTDLSEVFIREMESQGRVQVMGEGLITIRSKE